MNVFYELGWIGEHKLEYHVIKDHDEIAECNKCLFDNGFMTNLWFYFDISGIECIECTNRISQQIDFILPLIRRNS